MIGSNTQMLPGIKILIVDDVDDHRKLIKWSLGDAFDGSEISIAENAADALIAISAGDYDCIIVDYSLPDHDGLWLLEELQHKENIAPIVFITAHGDENITAKAFSLGASEYVSKQSNYGIMLPSAVVRAMQRRRRELSLERERDQYRKLAEHSGDCLLRFEALTGHSIANPAFERITGYALEDLGTADLFIACVAEDDRPQLLSLHSSVMTGIPPAGPFTFRLIRKDGGTLWLQCSLTAEYDDSGSLIAVDIVGRDITALKREEKSRLEIEERYRTVFESAGDAMMLVENKTQLILLVNQAWVTLTGYNKEDATHGLVWTSLVPHHSIGRIWQNVLKHRKDDSRLPAQEEEILCKDGSLKTVILSIELLRDRQSTLVTMQDISERLRHERELHETEETLQAIISASPISIIDIDVDGNVHRCWNQAAKAMFGWSAEEAIGKPLCIVPKDKAAEHRSLMHRLLDGQLLRDIELVRQRKDGSLIDVSLSAIALRNAAGAITSVLMEFRDITESKRLHSELEEREKRYRLLVDNMAEGIVSIDDRENVMFSNISADIIFGVFPDSLMGRNLRSFASEEQYAVFCEQTKLRRLGKSAAYEVEIIRADGEKRILLTSASPQYDAAGRFIGSFGPVRDITERKRVEEALRLDESRLEALFQLDQMTAASEEDLFAFALAEAIRLTQSETGFIALIDEENRKVIMHTWLGEVAAKPPEEGMRREFSISDSGPFSDIVKHRRPVVINSPVNFPEISPGKLTGNVGISRRMSVPVFDGDKLVAAAGVGNKKIDYDQSDLRQLNLLIGGLWRIIQRRRAISELHRSEEFNRAIVENSPIGINVRSSYGKLLSYNSAWQLIYGLSDVEIDNDMRRERSQLVFDDSDEYLSDWQPEIQNIYESGGSLYVPEVRTTSTKPGAAEWVSKYFYAIKGSDGLVDRVVILTQDVTYRKHMEDALVKSEERFKAITETALDAIYIKDTSLRYVHANPTTLRILGLPTTALYGKTFSEVFGTAQAEDSIGADYAALQGNIAQTNEMLIVGGVERAYSVIKVPLRDSENLVIGVCCIARDVTERESLISELQNSQEQVRSITDSTNSYLWSAEVASDGALSGFDATSGFERIHGTSSAKVTLDGGYLSQHIYEEDAQNVQLAISKLLKGRPTLFECRIVRPDGEIRWLRNDAHAISDSSGKVKRVEGIVADITERRQAEEQVLAAERRFRELLDSVQLMALGLDSRGKVFYANPYLADLLGMPRESLPGVSWTNAFVPAHSQSAYKAELSVSEGAFKPHFEGSIKLSNGEERLVAWSNTILRDGNGRPVGIMSIGQDITDARKAEEELWRASEIRRALASSVMAAQETERSRIARELHDVLGQLLTGLKMEIDYIRTHHARDDANERVTAASSEVDEVIGIVRDLAYGLRPPVLDDLGVGPALESLAAETERKSGIKCTAYIHARTDTFAPELSTALYRITQEALTNAVRHSGAKSVDVSLRRTKSSVNLTISDDGNGFNLKIGESPQSLGIAGMRERTALLNGNFSITSGIGTGTVVLARFPVHTQGEVKEVPRK